jgi:site-specific DNA recombinase
LRLRVQGCGGCCTSRPSGRWPTLGERISRASRQRAERGQWHGGPVAPWGYAFSTCAGRRSLAVVPERAVLVREAAERVLAGESLYRIRKDWNSRGLTSTAGRSWRSQGIKRLLVRGAAAGFNERGGEFYPGDWEPILDEATWRRLRALLLDPRATPAPSSSAAGSTC